MGQDRINQLLQQGIAAARGNRPDVARGMFQQVLNMDPRNEVAWAWLATIARNNQERLIFLRKLHDINPQNDFALKGLRALGVDPEAVQTQAQPSPAPQSSVPYLEDTRFARVQQATDDFLLRYAPEPRDEHDLTWERQPRNRYGERGAQRLRQGMYAAAAVTLIALVGIVLVVLTQLDLGVFEGEEVALATRVPTQTVIPSLTPTQGGPTPTTFPARMAIEPTRIPPGVPEGQVYRISSPTPIEPRPDVNVERTVEEALGYYAIEEYEEAARILREERERSIPCYPSVPYYEALSYARMGDLSEAEDVLEWAQTYTPPQRQYEDCQDAPLITAGLAELAYLRNPGSPTALSLSEEALDAIPDFVPAILTKARVQLAQDSVPAAWQTVNRALEMQPNDTNLLLLIAEIELINEQPVTALDYIGRALYIDPDLLQALYLQTEAYLTLAEQADPGSERQAQAYGLAVRSAQTINQFYEGDPRGYFYLAEARIGEEKYVLAETALSQILAVENALPERFESLINDSYRLRGNLHFRQGQYEEALEDLETYASRVDEFDPGAVELLVRSALTVGDYSLASSWVTQLVNLEPDNQDYRLWQAELWVETCTLHADELVCRYDDMLRVLNDSFINQLSSTAQRADAYSLRAQARYQLTARRSAVLDESERAESMQQALDDVTQALALRDAPLDHYYRGVILQELDQSIQAYEEYQWLDFWRDIYDYPFADANFETRFAAVASEVRSVAAALVTTVEPPTPPPSRPTPEATPTADDAPVDTETPEPEEPEPTATPRVLGTATPTPEPTDLPAEEIP